MRRRDFVQLMTRGGEAGARKGNGCGESAGGGDAAFRLVHKERLDEPGNFLRGPEEDRSGNDKDPWRLPKGPFAINGRNERVRTSASLLPKQGR